MSTTCGAYGTICIAHRSDSIQSQTPAARHSQVTLLASHPGWPPSATHETSLTQPIVHKAVTGALNPNPHGHCDTCTDACAAAAAAAGTTTAGTTTAGATTAAFSGGGALVGTGVTTTQSGAGMVRGRWLRSYSRLSATCSSSSSFLRSAYSCHHLAHRQYAQPACCITVLVRGHPGYVRLTAHRCRMGPKASDDGRNVGVLQC